MTKQNTTKPSNTTKPVIEAAITSTEKAVFKLLVDSGNLESQQNTISDKLLTVAKAADTVQTFLDACRNAEKAYKAINKSNTIPRAWTQTKSDIKAMFSELASFDTISQLKKVKNIQAAEKRKADKAAETADKVEQAKAETNVVNTANVLSAKLEALTVLLAEMPQDLAESMLNVFTAQAKTALETVNEKPKATKPKAKAKAKPKAKAKLDKAI